MASDYNTPKSTIDWLNLTRPTSIDSMENKLEWSWVFEVSKIY